MGGEGSFGCVSPKPTTIGSEGLPGVARRHVDFHNVPTWSLSPHSVSFGELKTDSHSPLPPAPSSQTHTAGPFTFHQESQCQPLLVASLQVFVHRAEVVLLCRMVPLLFPACQPRPCLAQTPRSTSQFPCFILFQFLSTFPEWM